MTSTNTSDFDPAVRNAAWWSGDSRMAVNGKAAQAILIKQGRMEPPDLSDIEEVQMGKVMEPTIARLFQDKHRIELKDLDWIGQHSKETWLKAHGDYISADGKTLVECKNYNAASLKNFDEDGNVIPPADFVQLLHEAACFNVDNIYLAVLLVVRSFEHITSPLRLNKKTSLCRRWLSIGAWCSQVLRQNQTVLRLQRSFTRLLILTQLWLHRQQRKP